MANAERTLAGIERLESAAQAHRRKVYVTGLRAVADFYEAHPEIEPPPAEIKNFNLNTKEEAATLIRALGACKKTYTDLLLYISKEISPGFTLESIFSRNQVCRRIKTGERLIPAHVFPAQAERFVEEHSEDVYEWDCDPVLSDEKEKERAVPAPSAPLG